MVCSWSLLRIELIVSESQLSSESLEYFNFSTSLESFLGIDFLINIGVCLDSVPVSDRTWLSESFLFLELSSDDDSSKEFTSLTVSILTKNYIFINIIL